MNQEQFNAMMAVIFVPPVVALIAENFKRTEIQATEDFYGSQVFEALSDENLKVWHFSPLLLFEMYKEEQETGSFTYPEETF